MKADRSDNRCSVPRRTLGCLRSNPIRHQRFELGNSRPTTTLRADHTPIACHSYNLRYEPIREIVSHDRAGTSKEV